MVTPGRKAKAGNDQPELIKIIGVEAPDLVMLEVDIVGRTPYISNRKSEEKSEDWEKKMKGEKVQKKAVDPKQEWEASIYRHPVSGKPCLPPGGFKRAVVDAAKLRLKKGEWRSIQSGFSVLEDWNAIQFKKQEGIRDFLPLMGGRGHHNAYRTKFYGWSATIPCLFDKNLIEEQSLVNLMVAAGVYIGLGDHRVQRNGSNGTFVVKGAVRRSYQG